MREKKRYLHLVTILMIVFAALLIILSGCESAGADGGDSDESGGTSGSVSPGEDLELPEGTISDWNLGSEEEVVVFLFDSNGDIVHLYEPIMIDSYFPGMTIEPPPADVLLTWSEFQTAFEYELLGLPVNITDNSVRFQSFCSLDVPNKDALILRRTDESSVIWIYANGSTSITINDFNTGDYLATIGLQLEVGWNRAVFQANESESSVTLKTEPEPEGTGWFLE